MSTIGNSVKTILSRMSNVKAGLDDFEGESLNDVEKTLNRVGIALRDNQGNWYDFYDVLDEVASKWDSFSDVQQSQITTALGGTRQRENVLVALENWDLVKKYAEIGANSAGTAMEKYDIVLESVSAKQEQLNAKVQEFYMHLVSSGLLTGLLDFANGLMDIVNASDGLVGKLALATVASIALSVAWKALKATKFGGTISAWISMLMQMSTAEDVTAMKAMTLKGALDLLKSHPIILFLSVLTTAFTVNAIAVQKYNERIQKTIDKANELTEAYQKTTQEIDNNIKSLNTSSDTRKYKTLQDEFKHLTAGVDKYGNNISLTNEEYQRYASICKQIVDLNPDLMTGYESETEAIGNKNTLLEQTVNLLKEQKQLEAQTYLNNTGTTLAGVQESGYKSIRDITSSYGALGEVVEANSLDGEIDWSLEFVWESIASGWDLIWNGWSSWKEKNDATAEQLYADLDKATEMIQEQLDDFKSNWVDSVLIASDDYEKLDPQSQEWFSQYMKDSFDIGLDTTEAELYDTKNKILNTLSEFSNDTELQNALKDFYNLDLSEIDTQDYYSRVVKLSQQISDATGIDKAQIQMSIAPELDMDKLTEVQDELIKRADTIGQSIGKDHLNLGGKMSKYLDVLYYSSAEQYMALANIDKEALKACTTYEGLILLINDAIVSSQDFETTISHFANRVQSLSEQYEILAKAQDEYNQYGNITASTMQKIIDNGLLEYVSAENGQLQFNTQALQDNAEESRQNAIAKLQEALFTDLCAIANGTYQESIENTDTSGANQQLSTFRTELDQTKNKSLETAVAINALNAELGTEFAFSTDDQKKQADAVVQNYNEMVAKVNAMSSNLASGSSRSGGGGSKSSKEWWEKELDTLKDNLDNNVITMDAYISGIEKILGKLKKGSEAWKEVNKELQEAKLEQVESQFDRGEITIDEYINKLTELRKNYKANTEGYKELTETINDAKYDKFAGQYERGEITADQYIAKLKELQKQYKQGSEKYKEFADEIDEIKLEKTEKYLDELQKKLDELDQKMSELGDVNTDEESVKYAELLSQKYAQVQANIADIQKQLADTNLTEEQREALQEKLNDLLKDEVGIRDEIEDQVRTYYENQREQAEQQAELNRKELLYQKELELYGEKGKALYEWETNQKIKAIEEQIKLREAEKEALDEINEREQLENDLLEAKLKLQNALNNKTTKILKKQEDGTWQYEYSANMADVKSAKEEIENAEKALADFDWEQGIKELQDEADKLSSEMKDLSAKYEEAEFWANREYEQTMNGIAEAYGDIDAMVEKWMETYGGDITKLTEGYQSVVSANNTLEQAIIDLTTAIESKYETVGASDVSSKDGVQSFDTGGKIVGNGLILAHDKERVLTERQNLYFESFVSKIPQLLKAFDITKFGGYRGGKLFGSRVNADKANSTVINKVECVFPNINSTDGLQQAILQLPRLALQSK